ncbi:ABC transporter permease subunit [Synechococcus sp. H55.7]|uniref:ABC transporter permease n=1 Tax=unclassified Synechococcus TaxID=2626047 RepID=UPI0039C162D2
MKGRRACSLSGWMEGSLLRLGVVGVTFLWALPFGVLGLWAFTRAWFFPDALPQAWSLAGWQEFLERGSQLRAAFGQSLQIALLTTLLALGVGIPAGRVLGTRPLPAWLRLLLLLPVITSPLAVLMGIQGVLIRLRLEGTLLGVVLVHLIPTIPYMALVMGSVFARFDRSYEAQARCLGADPWQVWWQVTLPLVAPGAAIGAAFAFLISWNEFLLTFFVGGGRVLTLPMLLYSLLQGGNHTSMAVVALLSVLPGWLALLAASFCLGQAVGLAPTVIPEEGN